MIRFKATVADGRVGHPSLRGLEGKTMTVTVEPLRTQGQLRRYFGLVLPAATEYLNRQSPEGLPVHQTEVHHALERAFLGVHADIQPDSLTVCSFERMSDFLHKVEAHFGALGVTFDSEEDQP